VSVPHTVCTGIACVAPKQLQISSPACDDEVLLLPLMLSLGGNGFPSNLEIDQKRRQRNSSTHDKKGTNCVSLWVGTVCRQLGWSKLGLSSGDIFPQPSHMYLSTVHEQRQGRAAGVQPTILFQQLYLKKFPRP
ncbi:unnamed protein product, partial [Ectocarpus fasciculatus]